MLSPFPIAGLLLALLAVPACNGKSPDAPGAQGPDAAAFKPVDAGGKGTAIEVIDPSHPEQPFYHTLGAVPWGTRILYTYHLRNLENVPVTVLETSTACNCARIRYVRTWDADGNEVQGKLGERGKILTIAPGARFDVDVLADTERIDPNASRLMILRLKTDSQIQPYLTFELHLVADRPFDMAQPVLDMGEVPLGGGRGTSLQIWAPHGAHNGRLLEVLEVPEGLEAVLELIPGYDANYQLTVTPVNLSRKGLFQGEVVLSHTDREGNGNEGRLHVPIRGLVVDPIVLRPHPLAFPKVQAGQSLTIAATVQGLAPGNLLHMNAVRIEGPSAPYLEIEVEKVAENSFERCVRLDFKLTLTAQHPVGPVQGELIVELDDSLVPEIRSTIRGEVQ